MRFYEKHASATIIVALCFFCGCVSSSPDFGKIDEDDVYSQDKSVQLSVVSRMEQAGYWGALKWIAMNLPNEDGVGFSDDVRIAAIKYIPFTSDLSDIALVELRRSQDGKLVFSEVVSPRVREAALDALDKRCTSNVYNGFVEAFSVPGHYDSLPSGFLQDPRSSVSSGDGTSNRQAVKMLIDRWMSANLTKLDAVIRNIDCICSDWNVSKWRNAAASRFVSYCRVKLEDRVPVDYSELRQMSEFVWRGPYNSVSKDCVRWLELARKQDESNADAIVVQMIEDGFDASEDVSDAYSRAHPQFVEKYFADVVAGSNALAKCRWLLKRAHALPDTIIRDGRTQEWLSQSAAATDMIGEIEQILSYLYDDQSSDRIVTNSIRRMDLAYSSKLKLYEYVSEHAKVQASDLLGVALIADTRGAVTRDQYLKNYERYRKYALKDSSCCFLPEWLEMLATNKNSNVVFSQLLDVIVGDDSSQETCALKKLNSEIPIFTASELELAKCLNGEMQKFPCQCSEDCKMLLEWLNQLGVTEVGENGVLLAWLSRQREICRHKIRKFARQEYVSKWSGWIDAMRVKGNDKLAEVLTRCLNEGFEFRNKTWWEENGPTILKGIEVAVGVWAARRAYKKDTNSSGDVERLIRAGKTGYDKYQGVDDYVKGYSGQLSERTSGLRNGDIAADAAIVSLEFELYGEIRRMGYLGKYDDIDAFSRFIQRYKCDDETIVWYMNCVRPEVDATNAKNETMLMKAAENGQLSAVKWLLKHGANADVCSEGRTAIDIAREKNFPDIVRLLTQRD